MRSSYKDWMAEYAAAEPQRFIDNVIETGRKLEMFKAGVTFEPISDKKFRIPFHVVKS